MKKIMKDLFYILIIMLGCVSLNAQYWAERPVTDKWGDKTGKNYIVYASKGTKATKLYIYFDHDGISMDVKSNYMTAYKEVVTVSVKFENGDVESMEVFFDRDGIGAYWDNLKDYNKYFRKKGPKVFNRLKEEGGKIHFSSKRFNVLFYVTPMDITPSLN